MRYADLITLYFERSDALQSYWTVYVVVIGGLLAVAALRPRRDVVAGVLASILYCAFAYKNLSAIHDATLNRFATLDAMRAYHKFHVDSVEFQEAEIAAQAIEPTLLPPAYDGVRNFHIGCDVMTLAILWALQWRRHERRPPPAP